MPNIEINRLRINGAKSEIQKCINIMDNKNGNSFDLNKIIQMPAELLNTQSLCNPMKDNKHNETKRQLMQLIIKKIISGDSAQLFTKTLKEYEIPEWQKWAIKNWGTKWNTI